MTDLPTLKVVGPDADQIADLTGRIAILIPSEGQLDPLSRRVNRLTKGAVARFTTSSDFEKMKEGQSCRLAYPTGLKATSLEIVKLERRTRGDIARQAGAAIGAGEGSDHVTLLAGGFRGLPDLCLGMLLRLYRFVDHRTGEAADQKSPALTVMTSKHADLREELSDVLALAQGVYFTRDLVNEPANILTTTEFARRLSELSDIGLDVEIIDEAELEDLGMRTLLAVGQGSATPSKVVVMKWMGGDADAPPIALVGKGVVFDTGGISIKPAAGMDGMTMDMGGAGTVAGVMKTLAQRQSSANVVGLVGLVENMPDGAAMRPGDVIRSMKGDTVEVVNTDAEGRLVLADLLWYTAERFKPQAMVDLATLTGAIVVALGGDRAGLFCNDEGLAKALTSASDSEKEGLWRMPLGDAYAGKLKSLVADVKNSGDRAGGASTAAEFLRRFVRDGTPWAHLDIAGVATVGAARNLTPKGASGWGVRTLDRWIRDVGEGET